MNVSPRRRGLLLLVFAALGLLAAACGGLDESAWRRELEPLLPDGVEIVESSTENCTVNPNCVVRFVLEHDRSRYAEDVAAFEATMAAEGWTETNRIIQDGGATVVLERKDIRLGLTLLSESWRERCVTSRGNDSANCQSDLLVMSE
jgi:hypothetical protein